MGAPIDAALLPTALEPTNPPNFQDARLLSSIDKHLEGLDASKLFQLRDALLSYKEEQLKKAVVLFMQQCLFEKQLDGNRFKKLRGDNSRKLQLSGNQQQPSIITLTVEDVICGGLTLQEIWDFCGRSAHRRFHFSERTLDNRGWNTLVKALLLLYAHDRVSTQDAGQVLVAGKMLEQIFALATGHPVSQDGVQQPGRNSLVAEAQAQGGLFGGAPTTGGMFGAAPAATGWAAATGGGLFGAAAAAAAAPAQAPARMRFPQGLSQGTAGAWISSWKALGLVEALGLDKEDLDLVFEFMMHGGATQHQGGAAGLEEAKAVPEGKFQQDFHTLLAQSLAAAKTWREAAMLNLMQNSLGVMDRALTNVAAILERWVTAPASTLPSSEQFLSTCKEIRGILGTDPAPVRLQEALSSLALRLQQEEEKLLSGVLPTTVSSSKGLQPKV